LGAHPGLAREGERAARRAADEAWCELLLERGLTAFVDEWQAQPLWASQEQISQASRETKRRERLSQSAVGLVQSLRSTGLGQMPCYQDELGGLTVPVTLLAGELDEKFSDLARQMAERIAHSEIQIVPGAGHDLLLERPELITEVIRRGH
jgi:2-succinyl-6-hydroxy-2,4-cyclohexadiene-1-carboxylate synthase